MQNAPHIDVGVALHIEENVRVAWNQPEPQVRQVQLIGVTRGACGRVATDMAVGLLQGIDEAQCCIDRALLEVVRIGPVHIPIGLRARDHRLCLHGRSPA